eukprot:299447-Chlamydomonas_euryale.AAC.4
MDGSAYLQKVWSMQPPYQAGGRRAIAMLASCSKLQVRMLSIPGGFSFKCACYPFRAASASGNGCLWCQRGIRCHV